MNPGTEAGRIAQVSGNRVRDGLRILVVEDSDSEASAIKRLLEMRFEAIVEIARDCARARQMLASRDYDVVTIGYRLPGGDGLEFLRKITSNEQHPQVVMVTGHGDERVASDSIRFGASGYVIKDERMSALLPEAVERAIQEAKRRTERHLVESAIFRTIIDTIPDVIYMFDLEGNILLWNKAVGEASGYTDEEISSMKPTDFVAAEDVGRGEESIEETQEAGRGDLIELSIITKDGRHVPYEFLGSTVVDDNGNVLGICGVARDVSEQKDREERLRISEKLHRESEEWFRGITGTAKDAIITVNSRGEISYWNDAAERIFGFSENEALGVAAHELLGPPERRQEYGEMVEEFGKTGTSPAIRRTDEYLARRKDGSEIPVEVSSSPLKIGEEWNAVVIIRDITDRKRSEEREKLLVAAGAEAKAASKHAEELRDLVDVAAHELRHPATVFRGYARLLIDNWEDMDEGSVKESLEAIDRATDRLTHIVVELLETSRIERGEVELTISRVNPMIPVIRAIDEIRMRGSIHKLNIRHCEGDIEVAIDVEKIMTLVRILLDNAVRYSPESSPIDFWCETGAEETVYFVADRGPGIPEEDRERVFERFYQVEDARHHSLPGIGLGLYIARSIAEAHGGWVKMKPRKGGGSIFYFGIPVA